MTYRDGCDRLRMRLQRLYLKNKVLFPDVEDRELLQELSIAQQALNNKFKAKTRVDDYTMLEDSNTHEVLWCKDILAAGLPTQTYTNGTKMGLARTSEIDGALNTGTYATKFSVRKVGVRTYMDYDAVLATGTIIKLLVWERCITLDDYIALGTGVLDADWVDYDESAKDFGGSFKLPEEFDDVIIYQAIASWLPEYFQIAQNLGKEADASIMKNVNSQITYLLK